MPYFVLYTALLLLGCFFVGAWLACVTRKMFAFGSRPALQTADAGIGAGAVAATTAAVAARSATDHTSETSHFAQDAAIADAGPAKGSLFGDRDAEAQAELDRAALQDDPHPAAQPEPVLQDAADDDETADEMSAEPVVSDVASDASETTAQYSDENQSPAVQDKEDDTISADASPQDSVANAVAAASAAAAAAVAAAKASTAAIEEPAAAAEPEVLFEDILPSPDDDEFEFVADTLPTTDLGASLAPTLLEPEHGAAPSPVVESTTEPDAVDEQRVATSGTDNPSVEQDDSVDTSSEQRDSDDNETTSSVETTVHESNESPNDQNQDTSLAGLATTAVATAGVAAIALQDDDKPEDAGSTETQEQAETSGLAVSDVEPQDLLRIKGIDDDTQSKLNDMGISRYGQIAELTSENVASIDRELGELARVSREGWVEQAAILQSGRETYFSGRQYRASTSSTSATSSSSASSASKAGTVTTAAAAVGGISGAAVAASLAGSSSRTESTSQATDAISKFHAERTTRTEQFENATHSEREHRGDRADREPREPRADREQRADREPREPRADREQRADREPREPRTDREQRADREPREPRADREQRTDREPRTGRTIPGVGNPARRKIGTNSRGGGQVLQSADADDLKRIRGIGVVIEKKLNAMGVHSYAQIAAWSETDIEQVNEILDFSGRIERENWIEQARSLVG